MNDKRYEQKYNAGANTSIVSDIVIGIILILGIFFCIINFLSPDDNYNDNYFVLQNDKNYYIKFSRKQIISKLINNNRLKNPIKKKNNILFITYDNRNNEEYVLIHNDNISKYAEKYDYEYMYYNKCNDNVYWCKMFMVLDALKKNKYDYVMWLDSDTIIKDFSVDIGDIFNKFSSDIFIGSDNNLSLDITNAGVFAVKNSPIGIKFLTECIEYVSDKCIRKDGSLRGIWAGTCYEQGVINILIAEKYQENTTILTNDIIFNYNVCSDDVFIMHLYASSPHYRVRCFNSKNPASSLAQNPASSLAQNTAK